MQRIRNAVIRCARVAGPVLGIAFVVGIGGLGMHAARDWHRHGELGAGFFHLHFHVGEHDHDHPADDGHDHESPSKDNHQRSAVLTFSHALGHQAPHVTLVTAPESSSARTPTDRTVQPRSSQLRPSAYPRAPPI